MRIGITGARGTLGKSAQAFWPGVEWVPFAGDVRAKTDIESWLSGAGSLDAIIHFAALVPTQAVESDPRRAFETNVGGTVNLLETLRERGRAPWTFIASTSHVYQSSDRPVSEEAPLAPITLYGRTKLQAEEWAEIYRSRYGLPVCSGRIFSYTSPWQAAGYFIPGTIAKIRSAPKGAKLEIPGLLGSRDFLSTEAIIQAIRALFERLASGIYNVGSGRGIRLLDVVETIRLKCGRDDLAIEPLAQGTAHLIADARKLQSLGIEPRFDLDQVIDELLKKSGS